MNINVLASYVSCEVFGSFGYLAIQRQLRKFSSQGFSVGQVSMMNHFNQNDPFPQTYNTCWRNHPRFSYNSDSNPISQGVPKQPPVFD